MNTLWEKIIILLKEKKEREKIEWLNGGDVERESINWRIKKKGVWVIVKPSNVSRRARDLAEVGIIDFKDEGSVSYKFLTCPEILEKAKTLMPLNDKKQAFQARMYKFVGEITISREEEVRRLVNGIV